MGTESVNADLDGINFECCRQRTNCLEVGPGPELVSIEIENERWFRLVWRCRCCGRNCLSNFACGFRKVDSDGFGFRGRGYLAGNKGPYCSIEANANHERCHDYNDPQDSASHEKPPS